MEYENSIYDRFKNIPSLISGTIQMDLIQSINPCYYDPF